MGPGGGIRNNGTLTLANSALTNNDAFPDGGGLANFEGTVAIINTTFARNGGGVDGPGILNDAGVGQVSTIMITNTTLADNGSFGGGIANRATGGVVVLLDTILARNTSQDCSGALTSLGNNPIGDPTGCTITLLPTDLTGDPGLGDFTDNGTPGNGHFPLQAGSPAIDAGNDAFCPPTDQLGQPRVGPCDMGAIEFQNIDP